MQIVDQLRKIADELPNYPQLELHRIAHEVLALQGKLQAAEFQVTFERDGKDVLERRLKAAESRLDSCAEERKNLALLAERWKAEMVDAQSRLDDAADMIANAVANHDGGGSCTLDAVRAAVWLRDVERREQNCDHEWVAPTPLGVKAFCRKCLQPAPNAQVRLSE